MKYTSFVLAITALGLLSGPANAVDNVTVFPPENPQDCVAGSFLSWVPGSGVRCATPTAPPPSVPQSPPPQQATSCVNSNCSGNNSTVYPVANTTIGNIDPMPVMCTGNWWINVSGTAFDSNCDTGWIYAGNCMKPDHSGWFINNTGLASGCPTN